LLFLSSFSSRRLSRARCSSNSSCATAGPTWREGVGLGVGWRGGGGTMCVWGGGGGGGPRGGWKS
jgi:hypothetical protein